MPPSLKRKPRPVYQIPPITVTPRLYEDFYAALDRLIEYEPRMRLVVADVIRDAIARMTDAINAMINAGDRQLAFEHFALPPNWKPPSRVARGRPQGAKDLATRKKRATSAASTTTKTPTTRRRRREKP